MPNNTSINDEINLIEVIQTIWNGKWKISVFVIVFFIAALAYQSAQPPSNFTANTEIKKVNSIEEDNYIFFNDISKGAIFFSKNTENLNQSFSVDDTKPQHFFTITRELLSNLFLEALKDQSLFEEGIKKYSLLDRDNFGNEKNYDNAVSKLASKVNLVKITKNNNDILNIIRLSYHDIEKWKSVLLYVEENANQNVKQNLQERFKTSLKILELNKSYKTEDLKTRIENLINDYERSTADRLLFLKEQAKIARALGVATYTDIMIGYGDGSILTPTTAMPFYLRGYEAIEKELELIRNRSKLEKKSFIKGLITLEQELRRIMQDKTLDRIKLFYNSSPLTNANKFRAGSLNISSTKLVYQEDSKLILISIFIGLFIGVIYTLFSSVIVSKKN